MLSVMSFTVRDQYYARLDWFALSAVGQTVFIAVESVCRQALHKPRDACEKKSRSFVSDSWALLFL